MTEITIAALSRIAIVRHSIEKENALRFQFKVVPLKIERDAPEAGHREQAQDAVNPNASLQGQAGQIFWADIFRVSVPRAEFQRCCPGSLAAKFPVT